MRKTETVTVANYYALKIDYKLSNRSKSMILVEIDFHIPCSKYKNHPLKCIVSRQARGVPRGRELAVQQVA